MLCPAIGIIEVTIVGNPTMGGATRKSVLVVEDEEELRQLFAVVLGIENYDVLQAGDAETALALLTTGGHSVDLIITDLGLPHMGGIDLIAQIRSLKPSIRILATSGFGVTNVRQLVMEAGADDFIPKPFTVHDVISRVRAIMNPQ
jgi:DNA-binding response OmpR family regulator